MSYSVLVCVCIFYLYWCTICTLIFRCEIRTIKISWFVCGGHSWGFVWRNQIQIQKLRLSDIRKTYPQIKKVSHKGTLNSWGGHLQTKRPDADLKFLLLLFLFYFLVKLYCFTSPLVPKHEAKPIVQVGHQRCCALLMVLIACYPVRGALKYIFRN